MGGSRDHVIIHAPFQISPNDISSVVIIVISLRVGEKKKKNTKGVCWSDSSGSLRLTIFSSSLLYK